MKQLRTNLLTLMAVGLLASCGSRTITTENGDRNFSLTYVSGHLGNYDSCPDKALGSGAAEPAGGAGAWAPPCGPNEDCDWAPCASGNCGRCANPGDCFALNCDDAALSLQISNIGELKIDALTVIKIDLLNEDGSVHSTLDVLSATNAAALISSSPQGTVFDTSLEPDKQLMLNVTFNRPAGQIRGKIRIRILGDTVERELTTPELSALPSVAT